MAPSPRTVRPQPNPLCEEVKNLVGPDLYRRNAFRILGVPIDAQIQAANKAQKLREMQEKLGLATEASLPPRDAIMPLSATPDRDEVKRAGEILLDPVSRYGHAFFWFWPDANKKSQTSLEHLSQSQPADVLRSWQQYLSSNQDDSLAMHNTAVLAHMMALDLEVAASKSSLSKSLEQHRWWYWGLTYACWRRLANDRLLLERERSMREAAHDPRLGTGVARGLLLEFPSVVLRTTAKVLIDIAVRASERDGLDSALSLVASFFQPDQHSLNETANRASKLNAAEHHLSLMKSAGWSEDEFLTVLETELEATIDRVREATAGLAELPHGTARQELDQVIQTVVRYCSVVEALLPAANIRRANVVDSAIGAFVDLAITHGNEDQKWAHWLGLNDRLLKHASDPMLRDRLTRTGATLRENVKVAKEHERVEATEAALRDGRCLAVTVRNQGMRVPQACTCCLGPAESEQVCSHSWTEHRGLYRVNRSISFKLPICRECERHSRESSERAFLLVALSVASACGVGYLVGPFQGADGWTAAVIGAVAGLLAMGLLALKLKYSPLGERHASRRESVHVMYQSDATAVMTFSNPVYGQAFADTNGFPAMTPPGKSGYRGTSILGGVNGLIRAATVIVLGMIASAIAYNAAAELPKPGRPALPRWQQAPAAPVRQSSPPAQAWQDAQSKQLSNEIDEGRGRVGRIEEEMEAVQDRLEVLRRDISTKQALITDFESRVQRGLRVDTNRYQGVVDAHNEAVYQYNQLLSTFNAAYEDYQHELDAVNTRIAEYNRRFAQ